MTKPQRDPFREWIATRTSTALDRQRFASSLGVTVNTTYNWYRGGGVSTPSVTAVIRLALKDGVSLTPDDLLPLSKPGASR